MAKLSPEIRATLSQQKQQLLDLMRAEGFKMKIRVISMGAIIEGCAKKSMSNPGMTANSRSKVAAAVVWHNWR
jgi:hypothetical protein